MSRLHETYRPQWQFQIPSAYDGTKVACRFYHPSQSAAANAGGYRCAVVAHPYAPLGGSYDDPIVGVVAKALLDVGFYVATFNFRKPGILKGNTSLSGTPEVHDYASVVACFTTYLISLKEYKSGGYPGEPEALTLVLAGYSYGSLIASRLPAARTVGDIFAQLKLPSSSGKHLDSIATQGRLHAYRFFHGEAEQNPELGDPADQEDILISPAYCLVSPLLGPVVYMVTPTASSKPGNETSDSHLVQNPTFAIYGDADTFTSGESLGKWCTKLSEMDGSKFQSKMFQDVDHFWYMTGAMKMLERQVRDWVTKDVLPKG